MPARQFDDQIREIAEDFLQSVVVVDDHALPGAGEPPTDLQDVGEEVAPGGLGITQLKEPAGDKVDTHDLPAKELIDAFALNGLVCSILDPDDAVGERLKRTAARADLLVIDWWMHGQRGVRALELISAVLSQDEKSTVRRLRVIAVYTGQSDLVGVANDIEPILDQAYEGSKLSREANGLAMQKGPVRIVVLAKEAVTLPEAATRANRVKVEELPTRLAREFALLARGLVSGVGLRALAAVRNDTHRILQNLGSDLDPGYLGHRLALPRPSDAEGHLTEMVTGEIRAVLRAAQIGEAANLDAIDLWLKSDAASAGQFGALFAFNEPMTKQQIARMLRDGLGDESSLDEQHEAVQGRSKGDLKKVRKSGATLFCSTEDEATDANGKFASRMMFRTSYRKPARRLQLGTIVTRKKRFWMCVQPYCDSERLKDDAPVGFPLLPLTLAAERRKVDFLVPWTLDQSWLRLALDRSPSQLELVEFLPNGDGIIGATKLGHRYFFRSKGGSRYFWVGELKSEFAQKVAGELGHQFSRVGVDEPEILRRSGTA